MAIEEPPDVRIDEFECGAGVRLRAGVRRWGRVRVSRARSSSYLEVVVYPPGTNAEQLRWMCVWGWLRPVSGLVVLSTAIVLAHNGVGPAMAGTLALVVLCAWVVWIEVGRRTAACRSGSSSVQVWIDRHSAPAEIAALVVAGRVSYALDAAESARRADRISEVEFESRWAHCHSVLESIELTSPTGWER